MSNNYFRFKQFTIKQEHSAMKVGVDSVLLGAMCDAKYAKRVLDVGSGTGLLALMLAQKNPQAYIKAVEIDPLAAQEARMNVEASPWCIEVVCEDFRKYAQSTSERFDLIISNPPYFENSLKNSDEYRSTARHDKDLSFEELLSGVSRLMDEDGHFDCILPASSVAKFSDIARKHGLYPCKSLRISTVDGKSPKRVVLSFIKRDSDVTEMQLSVMTADTHAYTAEYISLTKDFYLFENK